ncbi:hypothetical protein JTE90_010112, partial [Oedothorax gibbosus]
LFTGEPRKMEKMLCVNDFEAHAKKHLNRQAWSFYSQGAEREFTLRENPRSFTRYILVPRMLRNTAKRDLSVTVLGERISMPIGIAPAAYQRLAHPDGELAAARAAAKAGTVYTLSSVSSTPMEDVAKCKRDSPQWMQLYQFKCRDTTREVVKMAEESGYKALVLTVDTPVIGLQLRVGRNGLDIPPHISVPILEKAMKKQKAMDSGKDHLRNVMFLEDTMTWEDVAWLKSITHLPIVLKGILSAEDAKEALKYGVSAVWVSNHGGRQLDGVPTALEVLPGISRALEGSGVEVYADGGVRWGSDVFKLLALGARAVFIGRPNLWGQAHSGEDGVNAVLNILKNELDRTMHLAGCKCIADIGPHLIAKRPIAKM